jgi:outer membrane protein assembly factor BamB
MGKILYGVIVIIFILLFASFDLYAQEVVEGTLKWRFDTGQPYYDPETGSVGIITSPAIDDGGTIYVLNNHGTFYAINPDGTEKWHYETGDSPEAGGPGFVSPSIGQDGTIYVKAGSGKLFAFDNNGQLKWVYEDFITGGADFGYGLPIDKEGAVILPEWQMRAINPDKTVKWIISESLYTLTTPGIGPDGSIYTISNDGILRSRDNGGNLQWVYDCQGTTYGNGVAVDNNGIIYFGNLSTKKLYAIYPDGKERWSFSANQEDYGDGEIISSPIIGYNGNIYVVGGFYLFCLTNQGLEKWKVNIEPGHSGNGSTKSSPALGADGTVFVMSNWHDTLFAISEFGTIKWEYMIGGGSRSSPAIGSDGTLYIGGLDGFLYAIRTECGGLAKTEWPMFGRNTRHISQQSGNYKRASRVNNMPSLLLLLEQE